MDDRKAMGGAASYMAALRERLNMGENRMMRGKRKRMAFSPVARKEIGDFRRGQDLALGSGKRSPRALESSEAAAGKRGPLPPRFQEAARSGEYSVKSDRAKFLQQQMDNSRPGRPKGSLRRGRGYPIP